MQKYTSFGTVYLVGAGPGATDLITVRGAKLLEKADIVFHDALVEAEMLNLCPQAIKVPVGKRCGKLSSAQHFINKRLVDAAQQYKTIVRLKGGDPMLFGRADEEIGALKKLGIEVEVVPGITAALAGAASLQQSLTLRGVSRSVAFVTLAQATEELKSAEDNQIQPIQSPNADTLVYYMGRKDTAKIAQQLINGQSNRYANTPVHVLEAVSTQRERHWSSTLGELAKGAADAWFDSSSPALIMVGEALRDAMKIKENLESSSPKINDSLQDSQILTNSRRRA
ncbi:uroporphyrinogen-III C-methyltransferase [Polynucleobacter paneuropaeus]|uniref:uroporphyrinogen-III C-methyltransferase n=1 Tax=Polynucleobacter paneuropaeus TaxID=2527775 RepID=UPI001BFEC393|nr:uroporphyrinogen-III C-methyltransferase [Polynucleobacter paneuropaeus]MBT8526780.1 uroporphyrinogen-III C-methyltransferase [Polynucleobacter paneuropaeus]MBT8533442.1 uroporphyrinogen-III C-methyltransferase [Polynucleobacter paneuropaeus]MBT8634582.1 uroporphyrinogen-III C-methyltransferase [Polynucleobacter paneuropaeus]QWC95544.1 uroporphyrinogen-III C-methyltransferase [Polynucleobacter paneuropaeus]QWD51312.1 uroporphyrinogen-III C-methyltransferase [Polynucleobacter paneuropaeus]